MGEIEIGEYIVEWDDEKVEINWKKHGVYFEDAARIFLDDNRIEIFDELHSDDRNRIISARYADKHEREEYYGQYSYL